MNTYRSMAALSLAALLALLTASCGSSNGPAKAGGAGTLGVSITDGPAGGFDAVNVTVKEVRVHMSSTADMNSPGWTVITLNPPQKINLLGLTNGVLDALGQTALPSGRYTQVRLLLSANTGTVPANSVVLAGTNDEIPLVTPSAAQSGIKLIHAFDVAPEQRVDLVLDFDALKSVVREGNGTYLLTPVITVMPKLLTGIDGFVDTSLLGDDVMVSAQSGGAVVRSTTPDQVTGEFFLSNLAEGNYDIVITADGHAAAVIGGVPVSSATGTAGATITSTSGAPISLPTSTVQTLSGTVTLNPPSPDTIAYVTAMQTVPAGPTVTILSTAADPLTGSYSLALPIGPPLFASFGTGTLPVSFNAQIAVAGQYQAVASASGYQAQPANADLSGGDVTKDFTLAP